METVNFEKNRIGMLLERYFNGETTLQEESSLREYFNRQVIDPEFQKYSSLFNYFSKQMSEYCSIQTSELEMPEEPVVVKPYAHFRRHAIAKNVLFRSYSLTAAAALAVFAYFIWPVQQNGVEMMVGGVKVNNEQLAISKTDTQLAKISSMMNQVTEKTSSLNKLGDVKKTLALINGFGKEPAEDKK